MTDWTATALMWAGLLLGAYCLHARREARRAGERAQAAVDVRSVRRRLDAQAPTEVIDLPLRHPAGRSRTFDVVSPRPGLVMWVCPRRHPDGMTRQRLLEVFLDDTATTEHVMVVRDARPGWEAELAGKVRNHQFVCSAPRPRRPIDGQVSR